MEPKVNSGGLCCRCKSHIVAFVFYFIKKNVNFYVITWYDRKAYAQAQKKELANPKSY